jgi:hypothetical protein
MMVGVGIEVFISVSFLRVDLVGDGAIWKVRYENIYERDWVFLFVFHGELDVGGKVVKRIEEIC